MHRVYWMEGEAARTEAFAGHALASALALAEALRRRRRDGEEVSFVTIVSEDPDHVGEGGVADPAPDYGWTKRRAPRRDRSR